MDYILKELLLGTLLQRIITGLNLIILHNYLLQSSATYNLQIMAHEWIYLNKFTYSPCQIIENTLKERQIYML